MALRTARGERPDPAARLRALTRRAYTAGSGHLDLDAGEEFDRIIRGERAPSEPAARVPLPAGPGTRRELRSPRRWAVSVRAAAVVLAVVAVLTGVIVIRSVALGPGQPVAVPERTQSTEHSAPGPAEGGGPSGSAQDAQAADPGPGTHNADPSGGQPAGAGDLPPASADPAASDAKPPGVSPVVHVAGAVAAPGIVELPAGARVAQAIEAAGGATSDAELAAVNLARPVTDGEQVYVPRVGEAEPGTAAGLANGGTAGAPGGGADAGGAESEVVDLNTADQARLETLPGVGPAIAQRILDWRAEHGRFHSVEELLEVSGIGPATLERLRERVRV